MHRVACLGYDGMAPFELGVVCEVFALPRPELGAGWSYDFALCAERPGRLRAVGGFAINAPHGLEALARADTVIVPGVGDPRADPSAPVLDALRAAHARGARVVSICSGAFALAAAGLLDGEEAATHWRYAELLRERFPRVRVNADVLYVDGGRVLTSAGTAAGIDLCLHLVRADHGAELASRAHLSPRQLERRFLASVGTSPGRWLIGQRVQASLEMLEAGAPVEDVADAVGFTPAGYRRHFRARLGVSPSAYRQRFR